MTRAAWALVLWLAGCSGRVEPAPISNAAPSTSVVEAAPAASAKPGPSGPEFVAAPPRPTPPPLPSALPAIVARKPYVEERCAPAPTLSFPAAQHCKYEVMGVAAEVTIANPSAERVAEWVFDAAAYVKPLEAIRATHPEIWLRGVTLFMTHIKQQSSRIFPIDGEIVEDLGSGPKRYAFDRGVVTPCDRGNCRCRINSLTVGAYCRYRESRGDDKAACVERYEGNQGDQAWRDACRDNHARALEQPYNEHFRARAFNVGQRIEERCQRGCKPDEVVARIQKELGVK